MSESYIVKINLAEVGEVRTGKDGRRWLNLDACFHGKNGAEYLDAIAWLKRDGPGQYGDTHCISQSLSKEDRAKGIKGKILGNMKPMQARTQDKTPAPPNDEAPANNDGADSIPF